MQAGKHSAIEDKEFATALIKSYEYQSPEQKIKSGRNLKADEFTEKIYREVDWHQ